jgi:hypothetical protein
LVSDILGWTRIDNVDGIVMCMMEEGAAILGSIQEDVCSISDFAPFGFTNTVHLLMFWGGCFKFNSKVIACCYEGRSGVGADETDRVCWAKQFCLCGLRLEGGDDRCSAFRLKSYPASQFSRCGDNEEIG